MTKRTFSLSRTETPTFRIGGLFNLSIYRNISKGCDDQLPPKSSDFSESENTAMKPGGRIITLHSMGSQDAFTASPDLGPCLSANVAVTTVLSFNDPGIMEQFFPELWKWHLHNTSPGTHSKK